MIYSVRYGWNINDIIRLKARQKSKIKNDI